MDTLHFCVEIKSDYDAVIMIRGSISQK